MRKAGVGLLVAAACLILLTFGLEYHRVRNLCPAGASRVETAHDAINAMRNYRDETDMVGRMLAAVRQYDAFKNDGYVLQNDGGYRYRAGWRVEAWTRPLIARGYTVSFEYIGMEFRCDVYDCGGIDIPNCMTTGEVYAPTPGHNTFIGPSIGLLSTAPKVRS